MVRHPNTKDQHGMEPCVYYESIKRELKIRPIYECWCDERLQTKNERIYMPRITRITVHWVWNTERSEEKKNSKTPETKAGIFEYACTRLRRSEIQSDVKA
jgi:hypothetical protein